MYKVLEKNDYVKKNLNEYLKKKETNKNKVNLTVDEWKNLLFEYCNKNKYGPTNKTLYKGHMIGTWLQHIKSSIKNESSPNYTILSKNEYVKKALDEYLYPELKWNNWQEVLFEYCDLTKSIPIRNFEYKNKSIGNWYQNKKLKIKKGKKYMYDKLSQNIYLKENLDKYLKCDPNKIIDPKIIWENTKNILFDYCNERKCIPTRDIKHKDILIADWLQRQKLKIINETSEFYMKLSKNDYVKKYLDEFLHPEMVWDKCENALFEYCDKKKCIPNDKQVYNEYNIGYFFHTNKRKIESIDSIEYIKLSCNIYIKPYLDKYLKKKNS